ncbi:CsbD family protein [Phaeacidiphilus oryzae]|jgi:uncharacterized protein YjbJ (UPF0337 family)|uniref:CsbD family protein n=1 Tax=Phaeacidiphilus oryzae TaxID=348818 RepID=UPI0005686C14|nr:CsbD family protein [Phaeacidiphilus oryzae]
MGTDDMQRKADEALGKAKEKAGELKGDERMRGEGQGDQAEAKAGRLGDKAQDATDQAKEKAEGLADRAKGMLDR